MAKHFKATWLGDEDPASQIIRMGDLRFIKGEPTDVPEDSEYADMVRGNPTFAIDDTKAEPVPAREPTEDEQREAGEQGTEKAALKAQLRTMGIDMKGNPSVETLRSRLAAETK